MTTLGRHQGTLVVSMVTRGVGQEHSRHHHTWVSTAILWTRYTTSKLLYLAFTSLEPTTSHSDTTFPGLPRRQRRRVGSTTFESQRVSARQVLSRQLRQVFPPTPAVDQAHTRVMTLHPLPLSCQASTRVRARRLLRSRVNFPA